MNKHFIDDRFGTRQPVGVVFHRYADGGRVAILLLTTDTHEPWATATVNLPGRVIAGDCVAVKNWSEGAGLPEILIENGILEVGVVEQYPSGHVLVPVYRLTREAQVAAGLIQEVCHG